MGVGYHAHTDRKGHHARLQEQPSTQPCEAGVEVAHGSGQCLLRDIDPSSFASHEPYLRAVHFKGGGSAWALREAWPAEPVG